METLGLLLANGIILKRALVIMRLKASHYLQWHIYKMEIRLSGGRENIAEVLDTGLIAKADMLRLRVIAKGKGFEHALLKAGQLAAEHTTKKIEVSSRILGTILLVLGAFWAAFMIFAVYSVGSFVSAQ
jgi:type II secretory pathway component PulF